MNAPGRINWLARRQSGIGGSDVAGILGLSPWATPLDVYLSKVEPPVERDLGEPAYWGNVLESVVADEYQRRTRSPVVAVPELLRSVDHDWMVANIDRAIGSGVEVVDGVLINADGLLECKTASAFKRSDWGRDDDDDAIPTHYAAQAMWYLAVTGHEWIDVAALIGGQRYTQKRITRDDDTIAVMVERCRAFWFEHVATRTPPPPTTAADVLTLYPADDGQSVEAGERELVAYSEAVALRQQIEALEAELEARTEALKVAIGERAALTCDGRQLVTWKAAKASQRTDWKALAESFKPNPEWQDRFAAATTTVPGSRRFIFCKK